MRNIWRVAALIPENRRKIAIVLLMNGFLGLCGTAIPYLFRDLVNIVARLNAHRITLDVAVRAAIETGIVFFLIRLSMVTAGYLLEQYGAGLWLNTVEILRNKLFDKLMALSLNYYESTFAGDIMDRYNSIPTVTVWIFQFSNNLIGNGLLLLSSICALLMVAPLIGTIMFSLALFNFLVSYYEISRNAPLRREVNKFVGEMSGQIGQAVSQIATVRSLAGEAPVRTYFQRTQHEWRKTQELDKAFQRRTILCLSLINMAAVMICLFMIVSSAFHDRSSIGDVVLVLTLTQSLTGTIGPMAQLMYGTGETDAVAERLVELLAAPNSVHDNPDAIREFDIGSIEFVKVSFIYPGKSQFAVKNVSFRLDKGKMLALVGPSGAGKSTIIKLLLRLYEPTSGTILINGINIQEYDQGCLRSKMGAVLQDVTLFNDTISNNIKFSRPGATDEEVIRVCEDAAADQFIRRLPQNYSTLVGERGVKLSGGEKQRIAIARAMLRSPSVVILDEATSALDSESEKLVQTGLKRLLRDKTSIAIAHRLSTIAHSDTILLLEDGEIVQVGDHNTLIAATEGRYAKLHSYQSLIS